VPPRATFHDAQPARRFWPSLRAQTRFEIAKLHRELGSASMVYVTHDQVEAMTLADRIVLLRPLGGRTDLPSVAQQGAPMELYHHPENCFVAGFIGSPTMNLVDARVRTLAEDLVGADAAGVALDARVSAEGLAVGDAVTLGIRPEHVVVGQGPQRGQVSHVERLGDVSYLYLDWRGAGTPLVAKTPREDIGPGESLDFDLPPASLHLFRADGQAQRRRGLQPAA
jgi:multiple sugar transport system ATP-binding protein